MRTLENHEIVEVSGGVEFLNDAARALGGAVARAVDSVEEFVDTAQVAAHTNWQI